MSRKRYDTTRFGEKTVERIKDAVEFMDKSFQRQLDQICDYFEPMYSVC